MPSAVDDLDDQGATSPIPRRTKFAQARAPWWRPRSTFGRILLGTSVVLVLGALTATGIITHRFLTRDAHFRITGASSIQSTGLSEVNRTDVLPVFGEDIGRNIFFVPLAERRKQLEAIPWVQQATVMRFLPDRLSVSIVERTPVAFVRQGGQVELADADGVILSMPPAMMAQHHYSFPVVTGINSQDSLASRRARMAVYQRFLAELDQNNQHLTNQISEIDLSDSEDLRAVMPEQGSDILAHFGEDHFLQRLQLYKAHIAEWRGRYPKLIGVDLRYNGEVPLEMSKDIPGGKDTVAPTEQKPATQAQAKPVVPAAKPVTPKAVLAKAAPTKTTPAEHKAAEAKKKAAKLKAEKAKAAHAKAIAHKPHPTPAAAKQGI
jgi:cell division protein FtsQ